MAMECTGRGATGQIEELKLLVSERLSAIAAEIVAAIARTVAEYEARAVRLREENERHRSLLDVILKTSLPAKAPAAAQHVASSAPATSSPHPRRSSVGLGLVEKTSAAACRSSADPDEVKFSFTSCDDFLAFGTSAGGECPYCITPCAATEKHLMMKHYRGASHFILNGKESFVVPCMCKQRIQGTKRSHWHCTLCRKTIARKRNFDMHISKMHGITLLQNSQEAETDQSPGDEQAPLSSDSWCQKEVGRLDQEAQVAATFLLIKKEEEEEKDVDPAQYAPPDTHAIGPVRCLPFNPSQQPDEEEQEEEEEKSRPSSVLKSLDLSSSSGRGRRRRRSRRRVQPPSRPGSAAPPTSWPDRPPAGPHQCRDCGKTFHFTYTLRAHVQAHKLDGACSRRPGRHRSLRRHLQSHRRRTRCSVCGVCFPNEARLHRHSATHRPEALDAVSALSG